MRKSYLSLEQRIHNAEGAQAAETLHAACVPPCQILW